MKTLISAASAAFLVLLGPTCADAARTVRRAAKLHQDPSPSASSSAGIAQTTAAPLLLTLLKDLRTEAEASIVLEGSMSEWCRDARSQKDGMANSLQRQLDEANNGMRQVVLDSKRLSSEASLINSTTAQKEQQLKDAASTLAAAAAEALSERDRLKSLLDATEHAIELVEAPAEGGDAAAAEAGRGLDSEIVGSLLRLQEVDGEGGGEPGTARGAEPLSRMRSRELRQKLGQLRERLRSDLGSAAQQAQEMEQKHWIFTDHLNSSLMEIQSQIAAIGTQVAQRSREHIRLERRAGEIEALLAAVEASKDATQAACAEQEGQRREVTRHIQAESLIVRSMLKQQAPPSSLLALGAGAGAAPSLLQLQERSLASSHEMQRAVDDLESMARRFPQEAALYDEGAQRLSLLRRGAGGASGASAPPNGAAAAAAGGAHSALRNIRRFVAESGGEGAQATSGGLSLRRQGSHPPQIVTGDEVGGLYAGLLERVRAKQQVVEGQRSRCSALLRDAAVDRAALARSLKRAGAKERIVKAMISECEQSEAYDRAQGKQISLLLDRQSRLSEEAGGLRIRARNSLQGHAEELMALATDLGQQPSRDEQRTARVVRSLAQKVDRHRGGLELQNKRLLARKQAVEAADGRLLKLLLADAERNHRRLGRLQAKRQLLSGLAFAKAHDRDLGNKYQEISIRLCSADGMSDLGKKERELRREEQVLQASASPPSPA